MVTNFEPSVMGELKRQGTKYFIHFCQAFSHFSVPLNNLIHASSPLTRRDCTLGPISDATVMSSEQGVDPRLWIQYTVELRSIGSKSNGNLTLTSGLQTFSFNSYISHSRYWQQRIIAVGPLLSIRAKFYCSLMKKKGRKVN